jgi:hypothetical protein
LSRWVVPTSVLSSCWSGADRRGVGWGVFADKPLTAKVKRSVVAKIPACLHELTR